MRSWRKGAESRPDLPVGAGEKLLAWALADVGYVGGTRDALYLQASPVEPVETIRIPWEQVQSAVWDPDTSVLTVAEVGEWGQPRPQHALAIREPGRLLQLVRERVTSSILLQRYVQIEGRRGVHVIARRAPHGDQPVTWLFEYDEGVDPADPRVRRAAESALVRAREEVGQDGVLAAPTPE